MAHAPAGRARRLRPGHGTHDHDTRTSPLWPSARPGFELRWEGKDAEEKGVDAKSGKILVAVDPVYFRPTGSRAPPWRRDEGPGPSFGWEPKYNLEQLVQDMVKQDLAEAEREAHLAKNGYKVLQPRD